MDANFGPLPAAATHIQIASNLVLPTHPLPNLAGVAPGRCWLQLVPRSGPLPRRFGQVFHTPRPLDDAGKPVPWQRF